MACPHSPLNPENGLPGHPFSAKGKRGICTSHSNFCKSQAKVSMSETIKHLLQEVAAGRTTPQQALDELRTFPYRELSHGLSLDTHRELRTGQGEVVLGLGKSMDQLEQAVTGLNANGTPVLVTKLDRTKGERLQEVFPRGSFWPEPGLFALDKPLNLDPPWKKQGDILIVTAGASDLPVALEALGTTAFFDMGAGLISDVGVAGLHRMNAHVEDLRRAKLLVVVAGMEGALPSVLAGMLGKPIIAVPTSVGYGAGFQGVTALLGMLSTCAPGVCVVNIDNGFGAGLTAIKLITSDLPKANLT
jgi:hypothetical protein